MSKFRMPQTSRLHLRLPLSSSSFAPKATPGRPRTAAASSCCDSTTGVIVTCDGNLEEGCNADWVWLLDASRCFDVSTVALTMRTQWALHAYVLKLSVSGAATTAPQYAGFNILPCGLLALFHLRKGLR